jgi:hypothetical protein
VTILSPDVFIPTFIEKSRGEFNRHEFSHILFIQQGKGKGKGNVQSLTCCEGPDRE